MPGLIKRLICGLLGAFICGAGMGCAGNASVPVLEAAAPAPAAVTASAKLKHTPVPEPEKTAGQPDLTPFTFAWISDTQGYVQNAPETFAAMTHWIVRNRERLNIRYVLHTGDVVSLPYDDSQWATATSSLMILKGKLPVFAVAGNHDTGGTDYSYDRFAHMMNALEYQKYPTYGGGSADGRRRYDLITIGEDDFLLIGCGYLMTRDDFAWMNQVLDEHADRTAILLLHYFLDPRSELRLDGWNVYYNVMVNHPNVRYVFCGHRHNLQRRVIDVDAGMDRTIDWQAYAFLGDYQGFPDNGGGYIWLFTFDPARREIRATSYSPTKDDYNYLEDESIETFTLPYLEWKQEENDKTEMKPMGGER